MIMPVDLSRLELIDQLLQPIQKLIRTILPNFVEKHLKDPELREMVSRSIQSPRADTGLAIPGSAHHIPLRKKTSNQSPD